jgi:putative membrane protein
VNQVASGAGTLASGASQVSGGVDQLASGAGSLKSGADSLSTGVGQLGSGATQLASGLKAGVAQVPTYTSDQAAKLASVVAEPVALPILSEGGSGNSYAPLFCVIALWLGALALTLVFRQVPRGALASTRGSVRLTLRALAAPAAVSVVTGVACGLILAAAVGVGVGGWFACAGLGALVSLCFLAVHQGFIAWLGNTGRVVSLLLAVLSLAAGVVSTSPAALRSAADFLALGQARGALLGVVSAGAGGVGSGIAAMALWLVGGLVLAVLATARHRRARASDLVALRPAPALATASARRPGRGPAMGGRLAPAAA